MRAHVPLLLLLAACGASGPQEEVVARVGDAHLKASELEAVLPYDASAEERQRAVEDWIGSELLYQEALQRKLHEDIRLKQQLERTRRNLLLAALLDDEFGRGETDVSESEIQQHYDAHLDLFHREEPEVRVRHILLASQRQANARRADLRRGADFAEVARSYSEDPDTRSRGGELDVFSQSDDPSLWSACEDLALNEPSRPIRTEYGYHLIEVLERYDEGSARPLEQVRAQIVETIVWQKHRQRMSQLVETLKKREDWAVVSQ